jgi:hypothetical protein
MEAHGSETETGAARNCHKVTYSSSRSPGCLSKRYVPSQWYSAKLPEPLIRAWNPLNSPVPSEKVHSARLVAKSSVQRPTAQ